MKLHEFHKECFLTELLVFINIHLVVSRRPILDLRLKVMRLKSQFWGLWTLLHSKSWISLPIPGPVTVLLSVNPRCSSILGQRGRRSRSSLHQSHCRYDTAANHGPGRRTGQPSQQLTINDQGLYQFKKVDNRWDLLSCPQTYTPKLENYERKRPNLEFHI